MRGRQILAVMSLAWVVSQPESAEACSCFVEPGISTSVPWIGDTNVPLNVVPWVIAGSEVELHDEQGKVVPAEVRAVSPVGFSCYGGTELVPTEPLLPNTRYTIAAPAAIEQQREQEDVVVQGSPAITFTTGNGTLAPNQAAAPETKFVALDAEELTNSCVYSPNQACVWTDAQGLYEVRLMNGEQEVRRYLSPAVSATSFELGAPGTVDCVEIRTRDLAGQLSEPAKHCFDDAQLPHLIRTDFPPNALVDCDTPAALAALNGELAADDFGSTSPPDAGSSPPEPKRAVTTPPSGAASCSVELVSPGSERGVAGTLGLLVVGAVLVRRRAGCEELHRAQKRSALRALRGRVKIELDLETSRQ